MSLTKLELENTVYHYNNKVAEILGVEPMNIIVKFGSATRTAGSCRKNYAMPNDAEIKLSTVLAEIRGTKATHNTIIHELCHAYNTKNDGHGIHWKTLATIVGKKLDFTIERCFSLSSEEMNKLNQRQQKTRVPVAIIEVPAVGYKEFIYRKTKAYKNEYKDYFLKDKYGRKHSIIFTKLS